MKGSLIWLIFCGFGVSFPQPFLNKVITNCDNVGDVEPKYLYIEAVQPKGNLTIRPYFDCNILNIIPTNIYFDQEHFMEASQVYISVENNINEVLELSFEITDTELYYTIDRDEKQVMKFDKNFQFSRFAFYGNCFTLCYTYMIPTVQVNDKCTKIFNYMIFIIVMAFVSVVCVVVLVLLYKYPSKKQTSGNVSRGAVELELDDSDDEEIDNSLSTDSFLASGKVDNPLNFPSYSSFRPVSYYGNATRLSTFSYSLPRRTFPRRTDCIPPPLKYEGMEASISDGQRNSLSRESIIPLPPPMPLLRNYTDLSTRSHQPSDSRRTFSNPRY